jgi:hypothetical protein
MYPIGVYFPHPFFTSFTFYVLRTTKYINAHGFRLYSRELHAFFNGYRRQSLPPHTMGGGGGRQTRPEKQKRPLAFWSISGTLVPCFSSAFRTWVSFFLYSYIKIVMHRPVGAVASGAVVSSGYRLPVATVKLQCANHTLQSMGLDT